MTAFEQSLLQNKSSLNTTKDQASTTTVKSPELNTQNFKLDRHIGDPDPSKTEGVEKEKQMSSSMAYSLSAIAASAVELRRKMSLSRISESSPLQDLVVDKQDDKKNAKSGVQLK